VELLHTTPSSWNAIRSAENQEHSWGTTHKHSSSRFIKSYRDNEFFPLLLSFCIEWCLTLVVLLVALVL